MNEVKYEHSQKIKCFGTEWGGGSPPNEITPAREWNTVGGGSLPNEIKNKERSEERSRRR